MTIISLDYFPEEANERETIVILSNNDFAKAMSKIEDGQFLLEKNICYLELPSDLEANAHPIVSNIKKDSLLKAGNILVVDKKNPNRYQLYDKTMKESLEAQLNALIHLCQLLGAKDFLLDMTNKEEKRNEANANVKLGIGKFGGTAGFVNEIAENLVKSVNTSAKFAPNSQIDLDGAEKLMQSGIFEGNTEIESFYNLAKNVSNRLISYDKTIRLEEDTSKKLEAFGKLDAPILKEAIGETAYNKVKNASIVTEISYKVRF